MRNILNRKNAGLRPLAVFAASASFIALIMAACSHTTDAPLDEDLGAINMRITLALPQGAGAISAVAAQPVVDSLAVLVFRRGAGTVLETVKGVAVNGGTSEVEVRVRCVAEAGKKVGVELFATGAMQYFGVDEDVTVVAHQNTDVTVDASDIRIDRVIVAPVVAGTGETVSISWDGVPAATAYGVQESRTALFEDVIWETVTTDTLLLLTRGLGTHYFRVLPVNAYVNGSFSDPAFCYVTSGVEPGPSISAVSPPAVPPGGLVTLTGVNLDLPGTRVHIGSSQCDIVSARENEMVIRVPLSAHTDYLFLWSILGTFDSTDPLVVQRIAFVSGVGTGGLVEGYVPLITSDPNVTSWSGVDVITVGALDWRDMSVFDLIVIAGDTGDLGGDWGGDPGRAQVIAGSGAQVLAIGTGGAEYLRLTNADVADLGVVTRLQRDLYVPDVGLLIFNSPYQIPIIGPGTLNLCDVAEAVVAFNVGAVTVPSSMTLYATYIDDQGHYPLLDSATSSGLNAVVNFFWGYDGDPAGLTPAAEGFLLNAINMLMSVKPVELAAD